MLSTRCTISQEQRDGSVKTIICEWDGYLLYVGKTLVNHYNTYEKVSQLIELGDLYQLGYEIGEKHPFHSQDHDRFCKSYKRELGDLSCEPRVFSNFELYFQQFKREEFDYIFRLDNNWYVRASEDLINLKKIVDSINPFRPV
jgi:hypothetical protein